MSLVTVCGFNQFSKILQIQEKERWIAGLEREVWCGPSELEELLIAVFAEGLPHDPWLGTWESLL